MYLYSSGRKKQTKKTAVADSQRPPMDSKPITSAECVKDQGVSVTQGIIIISYKMLGLIQRGFSVSQLAAQLQLQESYTSVL